jgi:predicted acylesterase/phospholipase RssA
MRRVFNPSTARELFAVSLAGVSPGRERMVAMLRDFCGERCLESLPIALSVAVIDLEARAPRALTRGSMWQALAAATALPGLYPPWECDGVRLADALAVDPVPTRYLDDADVTIAVDLLGGAAAPPRRRRGGHGAAAQLLGALTEVLDVAALDASSRHAARADVIVRPAFAPSRWRDVELADHFIEAGRDAARQQLPALASVISPHKPQTGGIHG